jgi:hypothetical protein
MRKQQQCMLHAAVPAAADKAAPVHA